MDKQMIFQKMNLRGSNQPEKFAEEFDSIEFVDNLPKAYPSLAAEHPPGDLDYISIWELQPGNLRIALVWHGNGWYGFFHEGTEEALRARFEVEALLSKHDMSYAFANLYFNNLDNGVYRFRNPDILLHALQLVPNNSQPIEYLSLHHPQHGKKSIYSDDIIINSPLPVFAKTANDPMLGDNRSIY